ncbi:MAG: hypothetical protein Q8N13_24510 [Acidovorax sp.]|nr:hypothetical protein [Acidovorax sp.]
MDADRTSKSFGMGDRYHWAWGLIDFGNGTFQGAAHGLARLWQAGLWPYTTSRDQFLRRIDALFLGAARLTRADGSLEEAFPNEGSFCVTALVAFDLLCAIELLREEAPDEMRVRWQVIVRSLVGYLCSADETHALISNHLATAVAALARWNALTGDAASEARARELLARILHHQSVEGWFREYEGADPGYQSLCTYYLADVHRLHPDWGLAEPLARSIRFLCLFAHPDGSFGGLYGSRCTRFYYPAGIEALAQEVPEAAALARYMATSIASDRVVTLAAMDAPNLVPMFNAYCWSAVLWHEVDATKAVLPLPAQSGEVFRRSFPEAGLWVDAGPGHYTIVNTHKGGVVAHFPRGKAASIDAGVVVSDARGRLGSSQAFSKDNRVTLEGDLLTVEATISPMPKQLPTPLQFLFLRLLCLTLFRMRPLREWVKRMLVRLLITRRQLWPVRNMRQIHLGPMLTVRDQLIAVPGYKAIEDPGHFVAIHMASQGYWQLQDEEAQ